MDVNVQSFEHLKELLKLFILLIFLHLYRIRQLRMVFRHTRLLFALPLMFFLNITVKRIF